MGAKLLRLLTASGGKHCSPRAPLKQALSTGAAVKANFTQSEVTKAHDTRLTKMLLTQQQLIQQHKPFLQYQQDMAALVSTLILCDNSKQRSCLPTHLNTTPKGPQHPIPKQVLV